MGGKGRKKVGELPLSHSKVGHKAAVIRRHGISTKANEQVGGTGAFRVPAGAVV